MLFHRLKVQPSNNVPEPSVASADDDKLKNVNPILKAVLLFFVLAAMAFIKPARFLWKRVYQDRDFGGVLFGLGIAAGIASGIGTGYYLGWVIGLASAKWVLWGLGVALATFFYGWPAVYAGVIKQLCRLSSNLWEHVPAADRRDTMRSVREEGWLSIVLLGIGSIACLAGGVAAFFHIADAVHDKLGWGFFGYVPGGLIGAIVSGLGGLLLWHVMRWFDMFFFALVSAVAIGFVTWVAALQGANPYYVSAVLGVEALAWIGFGFPLVHILVSFVGRQLGRILENYDKFLTLVYTGDVGGYREFYLHAVNIAVACAVGFAVYTFAPALALTAIVSWTLVGLAAVASYLLVGKVLLLCGNRLIGFLLMVGAGYVAFQFLVRTFDAAVGAYLGSVISMFATVMIVYPVVYSLVRLIANPLLASWSRNLLVKAHDNACNEIFHAFGNTYADGTEYRDLFIHIVNVATTVGAVFVGLWLGTGLELSFWFTVVIAAVLATTSYMLFGKLMLKTGSWLPSALTSLGLGIFAGAHALASMPSGWYAAVPVGLVTTAAMFLIGFPLSYVATRVVMNLLQTTHWLKPIVAFVWQTGWSFFAGLADDFRTMYRAVDEWIRPYWASISKTWNDTWESVMETVRSLSGKR